MKKGKELKVGMKKEKETKRKSGKRGKKRVMGIERENSGGGRIYVIYMKGKIHGIGTEI